MLQYRLTKLLVMCRNSQRSLHYLRSTLLRIPNLHWKIVTLFPKVWFWLLLLLHCFVYRFKISNILGLAHQDLINFLEENLPKKKKVVFAQLFISRRCLNLLRDSYNIVTIYCWIKLKISNTYHINSRIHILSILNNFSTRSNESSFYVHYLTHRLQF